MRPRSSSRSWASGGSRPPERSSQQRPWPSAPASAASSTDTPQQPTPEPPGGDEDGPPPADSEHRGASAPSHADRRESMEYTRLGSSGLKVSRIAMGTMGYGDGSREKWALDYEGAA